jgi:hypothetical protein
MMRAIVRFLSAYVVFALTMCITVALLLAGLAYKPMDFFKGLELSFLLSATVIPLHVSIAFICLWIIMHTNRSRYRWLDFVLWGGTCGLFVFVTLPDASDPPWWFGWNADLSRMQAREWASMAGLILSGAVGGFAASFIGRDLLE